jgi:hypothetical protein
MLKIYFKIVQKRLDKLRYIVYNIDIKLSKEIGMLINDTKIKEFAEGRDLWYEYQRINGYAFRPNEAGLKKLSRLLDLNTPYIRKNINTFLEA